MTHTESVTDDFQTTLIKALLVSAVGKSQHGEEWITDFSPLGSNLGRYFTTFSAFHRDRKDWKKSYRTWTPTTPPFKTLLKAKLDETSIFFF